MPGTKQCYLQCYETLVALNNGNAVGVNQSILEQLALYQYVPAPNQLTDKSCANSGSDIPYTPEEDAEFARIERKQEIALLANVIRSAPTTSAEGIAARVLDAGYRFAGSDMRLK